MINSVAPFSSLIVNYYLENSYYCCQDYFNTLLSVKNSSSVKENLDYYKNPFL